MERNINTSPVKKKMEDSSSEEEIISEKHKIKAKKKDVNSWDCSSSNSNEKSKNSDWDVSTGCRETVVEPFDAKKKESDNWDSESIDENENENKSNLAHGQATTHKISGSSSCSSIPSISDLADKNKNSLMEMFNFISSEKLKNNHFSDKSCVIEEDKEEDSLLIEDLDLLKDDERESLQGEKCLIGSKIEEEEEIKSESNHSNCTYDDTTIWAIPKSERSLSTATNTKLTCLSEKQDALKLSNLRNCSRKSKSSVNVIKSTRKQPRSFRSECLENMDHKKANLSSFLIKCEGSDMQKKLETETHCKKGRSNFDDTGVYFAEYECRTITMDKDLLKKPSEKSTSIFSSTEDLLQEERETPIESNMETTANNSNLIVDPPMNDMVMAGPSAPTSLEVASLPDMIGKNALKERPVKENRRMNSPGKTRTVSEAKFMHSRDIRNGTEAWVLLDETGQYLEVSKNEVTFLLNGRSADAVLHRHKEHLIQNSAIADSVSQNGSLSGLLTKESIQNFLKEEDRGGEDQGKKIHDLERKVENTLLFIQPGTNQTASIRIIPVDTEMVHIWRSSRDNGSLLSSEVDLRLHSSQDSVENPNLRTLNEHISSYTRRIERQQTVAELEESSVVNVSSDMENIVGNNQEQSAPDYSRLLIETRLIVDNLTNSFKLLQSRLDGETNRSVALQSEVKMLRRLLKDPDDRAESFKNCSINNPFCCQQHQSDLSACISLLTVQPEKPNMRSDSLIEQSEESIDNMELAKNNTQSKPCQEDLSNGSPSSTGNITVNIYTTEDTSPNCAVGMQETNSLLQTNLGIIEGKMKLLQEENEVITNQNVELKKKLEDISLELEKYLASTNEIEVDVEEDVDKDSLRDQVCNLKLELDNLKKSEKFQEKELARENQMIREVLEKNSLVLEEWFSAGAQISHHLENSINKLQKFGILRTKTSDLEEISSEPKTFFCILDSFIQQTTEQLITIYEENLMCNGAVTQTSKEEMSKNSKDLTGLDRVISGYSNLIEECRKGAIDSKEKVMEDYMAIMMEKASLMDEIKILKTENEMLMQSQMEHYEKLKQTMIALKDRKMEISALESSQKLSEEERCQMADMLKSYEEQKIRMEVEFLEKTRALEELLEVKKKKDVELIGVTQRLEAAAEEIKNYEKTCKLKDEIISEFKFQNEQLQKTEELIKKQIESLKKEIQDLEMKKTQLESEVATSNQYLKDSQKEMAEYIRHLESILGNTQENLEKTKIKLKESNQALSRLKTEKDSLDKLYENNVKMHNNAKKEIETCNEDFLKLENKFKEVEEENERLYEKVKSLKNSGRDMSEALDCSVKECKNLRRENENLKEKIQLFSRDKEESLKEQKDLINKYALLSKEIQKVQEKYRNVKIECNERTQVIKYLEAMLKENILEYNSRIVNLEKNITHILEKIAACKQSMKGKYSEGDGEVKKLRRQLEVTCEERRKLESVVNNYYCIMKHLEKEVSEKERKVGELHAKLSLEQHKTLNACPEKSAEETVEEPLKTSEFLRIEKLESDVICAENELMMCRNQMKQSKTNHENEKKKLQLTIADLKSEISRYQLRVEVMMKNLSQNNRNINYFNSEKRKVEESTKQLIVQRKEIEDKKKKILELNDLVDKLKLEIKIKEKDVENCEKQNFSLSEELKNVQNEFLRIKDALLETNRSNEVEKKEKSEIGEKLVRTIRLIMEERSARQIVENLAQEKEKRFQDELDRVKNEVEVKTGECKKLTDLIARKKSVICKLQLDLKKMKGEIAALKTQVINYKNLNSCLQENINSKECRSGCENVLLHSNSLSNFSPERFDSCMKELKEARDMNLELRKTEGQSQTKILCLEEELRDARLLIKELQGDVKAEKKSKKAMKNMLESAKEEIEKCLTNNQIISAVADKITRHLNLTEILPRESVSSFR